MFQCVQCHTQICDFVTGDVALQSQSSEILNNTTTINLKYGSKSKWEFEASKLKCVTDSNVVLFSVFIYLFKSKIMMRIVFFLSCFTD